MKSCQVIQLRAHLNQHTDKDDESCKVTMSKMAIIKINSQFSFCYPENKRERKKEVQQEDIMRCLRTSAVSWHIKSLILL